MSATTARAPGAYQLMQAMSALQQARQRLLEEDPDLAGDTFLWQSMLEGDAEAGDCMEILYGVIRAGIFAASQADAAKALADKMAARAQRYANRARLLRNASQAAMGALDLARVEQPDFTATVAKGSQTVHVHNVDELTAEFLRTYSEPNKAAIAAALKAGIDVPGASWGNNPPTLRVSTQ